MIKKSLKQIYNNLLEHPEKNEIVKELCKLYNEERSKGKNPDQILDTLDKFLVKKKQNPDNIIIWFLNNKISSTVQVILGDCYFYGKWVEKNEKKAFVHYQKSINMNNVSGLRGLGYCYEKGIGIEKDENKALIYYQKSADMGDPIGIYMVGYCYYEGIGIEKDENKALIYYQKSADMCYVSGMYMVGLYYLEGRGGIEKDEKKAFEYFMRTAIMGDLQAIIEVGNCYRNGIGVSRDIQRANHWYQKERKIKKPKSSMYEQDLDDNLKTLLDDAQYHLSWIPYNEFKDIEEIGKGGFATVFKAFWYDTSKNYMSYIALKLIHGSNENIKEFFQELNLYCEIGYENPSFLHCYGISRHPNGEYLIVMKYAERLSLRDNLRDVSRLEWKKKLNLLHSIVSDLESIHSQELIHKDLHSGNILQDHLYNAYITDLGLTTEMKSDNKVIGVLPYVAPEVLQTQKFSQAADIYSLGIIMTELTTGMRAFDGMPFDTNLSVKICKGERPEFAPGTPDCYIKLAKRCMDVDPKNRPTATVINYWIGYWLDVMNQDDENDIKNQFSDADKIKPEPIEPKHPPLMYTSKHIIIDKDQTG